MYLQTGNRKDTKQCESFDAGQFQMPDSAHWQYHDGQIENEPRQCLRVEELLDIEASATCNGSVPEEGERDALETGSQCQCNRCRRRQAKQSPGRGPHGALPAEDA